MLRRIRQELSLTQEEAARLVGTDVRTWRRYESGTVNAGGFAIRTAGRRSLLTALCRELGVEEPEDWLLHAPPPLGHALPPVPRFVGRRAELARLTAWLEADGVIEVTGIGGMGKTALVGALVADRDALIWSLYADPRLERLLAALLAHLGVEAPPGQMEDALLAAVADRRTLLVLDGLEVVQSHGDSEAAMGELTAPSLRRLLRRMARGGAGTAVVTSRLPLRDLEGFPARRCLPLTPLSEADTTALLVAQGLTGDEARRAGALSGGHALSAAMVAAYVRDVLDGDVAGLSAIPLADAAADEPLARRLLAVLSATAAALSPAERDLMARAALFPGGLTMESLRWLAARPALAGALSGLGEAALRRLLARLRRRGLLFSVGGQWQSHPFVQESFRRMPGVPQAAIVTALAGGARLDRHQTATSAAERDRDEALIHTLLAADQPDAALGLYHRALGGFGALGLVAGEWMRGLRLLSAFSTSGAPEHLHPRLSGEQRCALAYDWGLFAGALGDLGQAMRCYRACLTFAAPLEPAARHRYLATAHRTLAYTLRLAGRTGEALTHIDRSLAASAHRWDHLRGRALHAALLHDAGEHDAAARRFAEAEADLGRRPTARWGLWLAEHLRDTGQSDAARVLTQANLRHCIQQGWHGHVAHCHLVLGLLLPPAEARSALDAGRRWVDRTGEAELRLCAWRLSATLAAADGDLSAARTGRTVASDLGFGWFIPRFDAMLTGHT